MTTLVIGGAASGKSEYAERLVESVGESRWYIATMQAPDDESRARVKKHRDRRVGKGYKTVECPNAESLMAFAHDLPANDANSETEPQVLLLDDFGNLVAGELFAPERVELALQAMSEETEIAMVKPLVEAIKSIHEKADMLVLVSNDIFRDESPGDVGVENYMRILARLNREVASFAENVCEVVAGLPDYYKGGEQT